VGGLASIWQLLFLGAPLLVAAVFHGLVLKHDLLTRLKKPLDFGLEVRSRRIFGNNKTWRGLAVNLAGCLAGASVQAWLEARGCLPQWLPLVDYSRQWWLIGPLLGLGLSLGELPNSFLKRQLGIAPGQTGRRAAGLVFFVLDQIDLALGIWVLTFFLIRPGLKLVLLSLVLTFVLHLAVSLAGRGLGVRKTWF